MVEFDRIDGNHDGAVSRRELSTSIRTRLRWERVAPSIALLRERSYVRTYLSFFDTDRSGDVSRGELLAGVERRDRLVRRPSPIRRRSIQS